MTTTINIDFGSKDFKIPGLESKFDFIGVPNSFVRCFELELNRFEITVLYQLLRWHSWSNSGVVLRGAKWIYKSVAEMIQDAWRGIKPGKLYRALQKLVQRGYILREQLHREHYGDVHACAAYNRRNYYSPVMEKVMGCIVDTLKEESPQTLETLGFSIIKNQVCQNGETDFPKQKNNTHTTSTSKLSPTPPLTPQGARESNQELKVAKELEGIQKKQEQSNRNSSSQKKVNPEPTPFTDVVKRPPRVEQKVNKKDSVQKPVQKPNVPELVQNQQPEAVKTEVEVMPPERVERSDKRKKTPKGTKPLQDFGLAPWTSLEQFKQFYRALIKNLPIVANSRSPQGMANTIIQQLKSGVPHSYWDDFINGLPIGTSTQQEWEVEPGIPHPMFIEYLAEKLIKGNNSQTREMAIANAIDIASSPKSAMFFWKEFKISLGNRWSEAKRQMDLGVINPSTPLWTIERPEPTLEEASTNALKIAQVNNQTKTAIAAVQNRQLEGSTPPNQPNTHLPENTPIESDPWLDEDQPTQKPKKPRISDYAGEKFKRFLSQGFGNKSKDKSDKRPPQPDQWRRQPLRVEEMSLNEINKALTDPILRDELTPQLIFNSNYELIKDELGKIIRIDSPEEP
ncbi:MAG: hypothetical protein HC764_10785 [Pleurocapsa sp. CRU_1_2]|nr:hypothetical protein [Pleurocapsa sp. CRU_1_2]